MRESVHSVWRRKWFAARENWSFVGKITLGYLCLNRYLADQEKGKEYFLKREDQAHRLDLEKKWSEIFKRSLPQRVACVMVSDRTFGSVEGSGMNCQRLYRLYWGLWILSCKFFFPDKSLHCPLSSSGSDHHSHRQIIAIVPSPAPIKPVIDPPVWMT